MASEITTSLEVWLLNQRAGTLWLNAGELQFQYCALWLEQPQAIALSQSLPLNAEPFGDQACRPFFAGLLPEGQLRQRIAQQCQISRSNDFGLLAAIGGDCAGAVCLMSGDQVTETEAVEWLEQDQLIALLNDLPQRPMLAQRDGLRLSLAGAQDKLPVVFNGARIGLPLGSTPSTHILKPAIAAVEGSVLNEAFCMALGQAMGLRVADAEILTAGERQVLVVHRYDRSRRDDERWLRLHQEDFCQALGIPPELKYQNEGGPDLNACFGLLRRATRPSAPQVIRLLDAVVFNALIGNNDAHAKNFSLLYTERTPTLAPLYDLLCTAVYPTLTAKMAMKLGSKYLFGEVQERHWEQFAKATGLSWAQTRKRVLRMAAQLPLVAFRLQADEAYRDEALIGDIANLIEQRCDLTLRRFNA
ncbi:type II toxin-antitoxin system HipA family toxin [Synechococcus sp. 8F6]|uniref:type II toxin-antitoxin system HipA family toxin n=1 Tax=Synechococcus sp. 8F6 TaxID=2025606 RepID=UPI0018E94EFF|nr:type II toxin-antitoxin system HipA family toxin [Synechococcus sp. 8F6]